jgi:hypothetical protein
LTDVLEVHTASIIRVMMIGMIIALMKEAVCTSETLVNIYLTTWQYIQKDSKLHTHHHENLKSHKALIAYFEVYAWTR